jgi:Protein of unknown function (DUF3124)
MSDMKFDDALKARTSRSRLSAMIGAALALLMAMTATMTAGASAQDGKSQGQQVYVPVYSAIGFVSTEAFDVAVTLSFRNLDRSTPIMIKSATYYDTEGKEIGDLLDGPRTLGPFGSTQVLIKQQDFSGDVGANVVVAWSADQPVTPPLFEAVMVGARGTQAFAFTSRGVVLE